jgi:hypothetical protein
MRFVDEKRGQLAIANLMSGNECQWARCPTVLNEFLAPGPTPA